jgi:hypothetical protein
MKDFIIKHAVVIGIAADTVAFTAMCYAIIVVGFFL